MTPLQTYLSDTDKLFEEKFSYVDYMGFTRFVSIVPSKRGLQDPYLGGDYDLLEALKSFLHERQIGLVEVVKERVKETYYQLGEEQIKLYNGKLPFVVFEGKADEKEKITIYEQGLEDFCSQILKNLELTNK